MATKIKNISKKIVSIGETIVLPDETITLSAKFENNGAINALVNLGFLERTEEKANSPKKGAKKEVVEEVSETLEIPETAETESK